MPRALDDLLADAAGRIRRYTPAEARASDAAIVDLRSEDARRRDGAIPGAYHVPRTVLEWRVASEEWRNRELDGRALILLCDHGYSSVLAAAALVELGREAGDVEGGFEAWRDAGLPVAVARPWDGLPGMGPPDEPEHEEERAPETTGVTSELLATLDLGPEIEGMAGRQLRMRMVTIDPGGVFGPVHDHRDRPGLVYVLQGTITDHRDGVATDYGPGVGWPEDRNTMHWLENRGTVPAVEISVDIVRDEADR